ncbi:MOSC domain-containing protein [Streptomyces sp. H27-D2]|uniref:MOSC domain-containing protein n=1 Tax=Streptomyces sp. H27-D2 TaxID=3046304 RepID=UPI002DB89956|nr:MOSC N-terminal beta barrel domain-containing protein [Streptomyces sp. H27-D2]MEC4020773.1 MOSC N-terminal beta barrel domain-containing protein [Streptomyces sp. H27-D2]
MAKPVLSALHVYPVKSAAGADHGEATVEPWGLAGDRRWMLVDRDGRFISQRQYPKLALARALTLPDGGIRLTARGRAELTVAVPEPASAGLTTVEVWRDKIEAVPAGAAAGRWLSAHLDAEVSLVHLHDPAHSRPLDPARALPGETVSLADGFPLLLTTTSSLDALNSLIAQGDHADEGPLPMNRFRPNVVINGSAPWAEDDWKRVRIGEVSFRVAKPCGRCVITTTDQRTAERGKEPLRTLARHRRIGDQLVFGHNLVPENRGTLRVGDPLEVIG